MTSARASACRIGATSRPLPRCRLERSRTNSANPCPCPRKPLACQTNLASMMPPPNRGSAGGNGGGSSPFDAWAPAAAWAAGTPAAAWAAASACCVASVT
eukprot:8126873-Lingulodinium_polyedra.AAC.1